MTAHPLDRPAWSALSSAHAHLALGGPLARRYPADIVPFAATPDNRAESLDALAALVAPGERVLIAQADEIVLPPTLEQAASAEVVQMMAATPPASLGDPRIEPLTSADAPEMLALATLTEPGPFSLKALSLGSFWGIRQEGRLVAMAGERLRLPGFTELSGVCTHTDLRGRGLGRTLSLFVSSRIGARGDTAFLHAYAANGPAIRLYESIGFRWRSDIRLVAATRPR
ncbi:GNAT family N-acetyltransferase [Ancylobacter sp. SL191]|uniref:GNAT family N-acetyltransferase n=1 Tax=Ancylobacter sp. SL191 TaxID=2995166 RepID=UPI002271D26D|nr:GNAT family N-acetyltransferase [Ancylobacter sp. SL191]WAC28557.1 GNAT family N-acetyltransferase [Ancylobacter sp. SL191]